MSIDKIQIYLIGQRSVINRCVFRRIVDALQRSYRIRRFNNTHGIADGPFFIMFAIDVARQVQIFKTQVNHTRRARKYMQRAFVKTLLKQHPKNKMHIRVHLIIFKHDIYENKHNRTRHNEPTTQVALPKYTLK